MKEIEIAKSLCEENRMEVEYQKSLLKKEREDNATLVKAYDLFKASAKQDAKEVEEELGRETNRRKVAEVRWKNRQDAAGRAEKALADVRGIEKVRPEGFEELTGTEIPADELKAALDFEDFNSKEQMMCGWRKVHRELHIVAVAYRHELKAREEAEKALEEKRKKVEALGVRISWMAKDGLRVQDQYHEGLTQERTAKEKAEKALEEERKKVEGMAETAGQAMRLRDNERAAKEAAEQQVEELSAWGEKMQEAARLAGYQGKIGDVQKLLALPPPQAYAEWKEKMGNIQNQQYKCADCGSDDCYFNGKALSDQERKLHNRIERCPYCSEAKWKCRGHDQKEKR